ncbi:hypothetical protein [Neptuniibacter sp. 1_MG-2023]|uniref:hypothetical protein n=1 Tax=Neptuniibacter sp. 1_MG-2023 TaxID=3062662 RepID=UPI0026E3545A|nr:hypothetical protein [Neptuniibacter sp. 1_MG-2023]MDO6592219.1 hypothetical protein [Neptuniibacter sp. 1_MG-2023]
MEKLKRKLSLLNIPVYEIETEDALPEVIYTHLELIDEDLLVYEPKIYFDTENINSSYNREHLNVIVFQTLLAVEESSILFVDQNVNDSIRLADLSNYSVLVVQERNVVDCIEVALHRISGASGYYNNNIEIISPSSIPSNSIIVIVKD